jgi:hypothetical protein
MAQSDVASELFVPLESSAWVRDRFRVLREERRSARTRITGVRLLAADPRRENLEPERAVQTDFRRLVDSLIKVRAEPGCAGVVLSGETFRASPLGAPPRLRFGLRHGSGKPFEDETAAAATSYRSIRRAIRRARFVVEEPREAFRPADGLAGLRAWVEQLRLRRRRLLWPWLLLLLLPLLLLAKCDERETFFGVPIETASLLLLVDHSSSMAEHLPALRAEARRVLEAMQQAGRATHAEVIAYAGDAHACFGAMTALDDASKSRVLEFIDGLTTAGGTNLRSGIELAAREIAAHGEPTTIVILTDARDESIAGMAAGSASVLQQFGGIEIAAAGLTPRMFGPQSQPQPQDANEQTFRAFLESLGGRFGGIE